MTDTPKKFYVYVHKYASGPKKGQVFYVGKGSGRRAWTFYQRADRWARIHSKYGTEVEILQEFDIEEKSFLLEEWMISRYRHLDIYLANTSLGGEGAPVRQVWCSNGMKFSSITSASSWLSDELGKKCMISHISSCASGKLNSAYGFNWSFSGIASKPLSRRELSIKSKGKAVFCSNGLRFESISLASEYLNSKGVQAIPSVISSVVDRRNKSAYGFSWSFISRPLMTATKEDMYSEIFGVNVRCSNGMSFNSASSAARWVFRSQGNEKASSSNIIACAKGKLKTAYGYKWSYET